VPAIRLKHVNAVRRRGRLYHYHRKTGERLPDEAEARALRVLAINATLAPRPSPAAGSIQALITALKASSDWTSLAPKTRYEYGRHLDAVGILLGRFPAKALTRAMVLEMRDGLADRPREGNYRVQVIRRLMGFALDRGWVQANPVTQIRKLKEGEGFQAWPEPVWSAFLANPLCYRELGDAVFLLRYSGQRPQDAIAMPEAHLTGRMQLRQLKTGARLSLPIPKPLADRLAGRPRRALLVLTTRDGRPWTVNHLAKEVRKVMQAIGQAGKGYTPHGLRHLAGDELAEAGASAKEIAAVLGHATLAMVQRYTATADQQRLADAASARLHGSTERDRSLQTSTARTAKQRKKRAANR
jgi:integrase